MPKLTLRTRILLWFVGLTGLILVGFSAALYVQARESMIGAVDQALRGRAEALAMRVENEGGRFGLEPQEVGGAERWDREALTAGAVFTLPSGDAVGFMGTGDAIPQTFEAVVGPWLGKGVRHDPSVPPRFDTVLMPSGKTLRCFTGVFSIEVEAVLYPVMSSEDADVVGKAMILVAVAASLEEVNEELAELLVVLFTAGPLSMLAAVFGGWLLARKIAGPIGEIASVAESIQATDPSPAVPKTGSGDEIDRLAETLNSTFLRLHEAFERQTRFTADASHELRTPLTVIKSHAQVALSRSGVDEEDKEAFQEIVDASNRLHEMLEKLLFLARNDAKSLRAALEDVDLSSIAREVTKEWEPRAGERSVSIEIDAPGSVSLNGDPLLLRMLISNLMSNAILHSPDGGAVSVRVRSEKGRPFLTVMDGGEGIPAEAIPRIFERFFRAEEGRDRDSGGSGLGLSIVKTIADLHGADVSAASEGGRGTTLTVMFTGGLRKP
ncbi:MAG: sensor histidine kinase [Planctomycetota bacterium]